MRLNFIKNRKGYFSEELSVGDRTRGGGGLRGAILENTSEVDEEFEPIH